MGTAWQNLIRKGSAGNVVELVTGPDPAAPRREAGFSDEMNLESAEPNAAVANGQRNESGDERGIKDQDNLPRPDNYAPARGAMGPPRDADEYGLPKDYGTPLLSDSLIKQLAMRIVNILSEALPPKTVVAAPVEPSASEPLAVGEYAPPAPTASSAVQAGNMEADPTVEKAAPVSHIAAGATVSGGIHDYGDGEVCVGGKFTPEKLTCGDLTILAGASVRGDIYASGLVKIFGNVDEIAILAKAIEIYDGAVVTGGNLKSETIGIQVGAHISAAITSMTMRNNAE